jgi:hypothetical protein
LASLTDAERRSWTDAVTAYARGPSRQDPTRDQALAELERRLADRDDARSLDGAEIDASLRDVLGYGVHVVRYASWGGAFSTGDLFLVSSNPGAGLSGYGGLESAFHEAMHTWDDPMAMLLDTQARAAGVQVARGLSHALVFFTAGEAVRRVAPAGYVPAGESSGAWDRMLPGMKAAVEEVWLPYLNGTGTRDEALAAPVRRAAALSARPQGSSLARPPR